MTGFEAVEALKKGIKIKNKMLKTPHYCRYYEKPCGTEIACHNNITNEVIIYTNVTNFDEWIISEDELTNHNLMLYN